MRRRYLFIICLMFGVVEALTGQHYTIKDAQNLLIAAYKGQSDSVLYFLNKGVPVDYSDNNDMSALDYAVQNNHIDLVRLLVEHGASVNRIKSYTSGTGPLIEAVIYGYFDVAEYLCQQGAKVNIRDTNEATALHYAAAYDDYYMTGLLLYYGANATLTDAEGNLPLHLAARFRDTSVLSLLLPDTAGIRVANHSDYRPIDIALCNHCNLAFYYLFAYDRAYYVDSNSYNKLLAEAVDTHNDTILWWLLGVNKRPAFTRDGNPLNRAWERGRVDLASRLKEQGISYSPKPRFSSMTLSAGFIKNKDDFFKSINFGIEDERYHVKLHTGVKLRFHRQAVLIKQADNQYIQLNERRVAWSVGAGKYVYLSHSQALNLLLFAEAEVDAFMGNYRGTRHSLHPALNFSPATGVALRYKQVSLEAFYRYYPLGEVEISGHYWGFRALMSFSLKPAYVEYKPQYL